MSEPIVLTIEAPPELWSERERYTRDDWTPSELVLELITAARRPNALDEYIANSREHRVGIHNGEWIVIPGDRLDLRFTFDDPGYAIIDRRRVS